MFPEISFSFAKKHRLIVIAEATGTSVYVSTDTPAAALLELQRLGGPVECITELSEEAFQALLETQYSTGGNTDVLAVNLPGHGDLETLAQQVPSEQDLLDQADDVPIVRLLNALFSEALKSGASDIHIESYERSMMIRFRVDGILQDVLSPDYRLAPLLVSRLKVMARLDIAEKRVPQDGRITVRIAGRPVDIRTSTLPSAHGERVVMRILDKRNTRLDLDSLGMPAALLTRFQRLLQHPNGIILVTGPTGSGKTTTLYAALQQLNTREKNILTVEDPIEYALDGIGQTQVNTRTGMTFAKGLRAMLRQDPDVVLVGEIRDRETAEIAVQASLTGHLVLSTLHTNDAHSAVTRMVDIGVEPFLIASALRGVLAQRLVRKLCACCRSEYSISAHEADLLGDESLTAKQAYKAEGCDTCNHTGYAGRTGIYDLLEITPELRAMIGRSSYDNLALSDQDGILIQGKELVLQGVTSVDEVLRCAWSS